MPYRPRDRRQVLTMRPAIAKEAQTMIADGDLDTCPLRLATADVANATIGGLRESGPARGARPDDGAAD